MKTSIESRPKGISQDLVLALVFELVGQSRCILKQLIQHYNSLKHCHFLLNLCFSMCFNLAAAAAKSLQSCLTVQPHRRQPTRLPGTWDSPGKSTGVGCHFLFQCMKVKSESEVAQSYPTPSDPMDCSLPGSSVHGIFQARVLERGAIAFSMQ